MAPELCALAPAPVRELEMHPGVAPVRVLDPAAQTGWDSLVMSHPDCSFFHSAAWARVLTETYDHTPLYFTLTEGSHLQALLPVMEVNSWLTGRRGVCLPFADHCEPLASEMPSLARCTDVAIRYGQVRGWRHLECRGGREFFAEAPASLCFYGHTLNLAGDETHLFSRFDSAVRRAVRKAEKAGLSVEFSRTPEAMRTFYSLHCRTRRRHGVPPQPFGFFRSIHRHILSQKMGFVALARHQRTPIAAAVFLHLGSKAVYKYGASDGTFQHLRGNNLVMWEAVRWYARNGFRTLDFGRSSLANAGLRRFKQGWGTEEYKIEYVKYDLKNGVFLTDKDAAHGWHTRPLNMLPLLISRMIGALFYKHMA